VIAYLIDGLILLLVNVIFAFVLGPSTSLTILVTLIGIALEFAYFVGFWTSPGRATPGMRLLRIQVIDAHGDHPLRIVPASARWLLLSGAVGLIGLLPVAVDFFGLLSLPLFILTGDLIAAAGIARRPARCSSCNASETPSPQRTRKSGIMVPTGPLMRASDSDARSTRMRSPS